MTAVHLPVAHTQDDIQMAAALARRLGSSELYVAWSTDGGNARPLIDAQLVIRAPEQRTLWARLAAWWNQL